MVNSVSISWVLPSLQRKAHSETQAYRNPLALTASAVQSFIPRPRATNQCQQTFHWNQIKPPLFSSSFLSLSLMQPFSFPLLSPALTSCSILLSFICSSPCGFCGAKWALRLVSLQCNECIFTKDPLRDFQLFIPAGTGGSSLTCEHPCSLLSSLTEYMHCMHWSLDSLTVP